MASLNYTVAVLGDDKVVAYAPANKQPAPLLTATSASHPGTIDEIVRRLSEGDETVADLFSPEVAVRQRFEGTLSADVKVEGGQVFFRGEAQNGAVVDQILAFLDAGEDFKPLVRFMEKLAGNPQEHSREQLYRWLSTNKFTITPEGDILAYKAVQSDYRSKHAGKGIVNGELVDNVVNAPGNVCEYVRDEVVHNPGVACAEGLHAGTYSYAVWFGGTGGDSKIVEVLVNPADVVSVPTDSSDRKMRVCRYTVLRDANGERTESLAKDVTKAETVKVAESSEPVTATSDADLDEDGYGFSQVSSSLIDYVEHDDGVTYVALNSGRVYRYDDPDAQLYAGLANADSAGAYWNANVKGRHGETDYA